MNRILNACLMLTFVIIAFTGCKKSDPTSPAVETPIATAPEYWKQLAVPSGVNSATVDLNGSIWIGTGDGVYKSTNVGAAWEKIGSGLGKSVLIKSSSTGSVFVAAGTGLYRYANNSWVDISKNIATSLISFDHLYTFSLDKDGGIYAACFISEKPDPSSIGADKPALFKSADGGQTWTRIRVQTFEGQIKDIAFDAKGDMYVIMDATIYHSLDGGKTFTKALSGLTPANPFVMASNSSSVIYAGTGNGLYKSTDYGVNWGNAHWNTYCLSVAINKSDIILVGAINACWISKDNGLTWSQVSSGLMYSLAGFTDCIIQTFDKDGFAYAILEGALYRSTNSTL